MNKLLKYLKLLSLFTWLKKLTSPLERKHENFASLIRIGACGILGYLTAKLGYYAIWMFLYWLFASLFIEIVKSGNKDEEPKQSSLEAWL